MKNPERKQDRAFDTYDHYKKFGYIMFPQQRSMYDKIATEYAGEEILEAGCGAGVGSAILERKASHFLGTDVSPNNVRFAKELYPWIEFEVWDIKKAWYESTYDVVVAIEVIEHVDDLGIVLNNLCGAAKKAVCFTTPNGKRAEHPPSNEFHVQEYTTREILTIVPQATIHHWGTFEKLDVDTNVNPLIYKVQV